MSIVPNVTIRPVHKPCGSGFNGCTIWLGHGTLSGPALPKEMCRTTRLANLVRTQLSADPLSGHLFVFPSLTPSLHEWISPIPSYLSQPSRPWVWSVRPGPVGPGATLRTHGV